MTTQLVLDFGDDARTPRRAVRPTVPSGAGVRAADRTGPRPPTPRRATTTRKPAAADATTSTTSAVRERLRPAPRRQAASASPDYWRLDERTKAIGVRGVEEARRILAGIGHAA